MTDHDARGDDALPAEPTVWFNPGCSKCRTTHALLAERGVDATYVEYLERAPEPAELRRVLGLLGATDARALARTDEPLWAELGLDHAGTDEVIDALHRHPALIQRPIVILGDRAVVARPPERVLDILDDTST